MSASCTNGDCGELTDCGCLGPNMEGTVRVCCCPSPNLDGMTCRQSLVLGTGFPDNWHQTVAQETLDGERPKGCEGLLDAHQRLRLPLLWAELVPLRRASPEPGWL